MSNTYVLKPKRGAAGWQVRVSDDIAKLKSCLVRKSDPGVVVLASAREFRPEIMRWEFWRAFNPSINNSRSDKLESGMWRDAFRGVHPRPDAGGSGMDRCRGISWRRRFQVLPVHRPVVGPPLRKPARKEEASQRCHGTDLAALNCTREHFRF